MQPAELRFTTRRTARRPPPLPPNTPVQSPSAQRPRLRPSPRHPATATVQLRWRPTPSSYRLLRRLSVRQQAPTPRRRPSPFRIRHLEQRSSTPPTVLLRP